MKATEQYFLVVLFIMLYKVVLTFESVDVIPKCYHSMFMFMFTFIYTYLITITLHNNIKNKKQSQLYHNELCIT